MVKLGDYELAPDIVWVGSLPGLMCRGAEHVNSRLDQIRADGRTFDPEVLAERDGVVLIDPHVSAPPQLNPDLHQILIVRDGAIDEIRDYPNRATAEAAFEAMQW
jgi:ketosteroid isomerase-like protein